VCAKCEKPFLGTRHYEKKGLAYCETHYHQVGLVSPLLYNSFVSVILYLSNSMNVLFMLIYKIYENKYVIK